jgi:uncharacterized protein YdaU (DUF1376 family)
VNYYERHLGDYAKDTGHLTMLEHGAYNLLLDRYYSTELGIPADQVHRVTRARSPAEKAAVDGVLAEFFTLVEGVWTKGRVEEEIQRAGVKINAAKENGKRGGRPKKNPTGSENETQPKPTGLLLGSENETQKKALQSPDTRHQEEKENPPAARVPPTASPRPAKKCPEAFEVTPDMRQWAVDSCPGVNVERETAKFRDHTFAAARTDWPGTWRNWLRNASDRMSGGAKGETLDAFAGAK